MKHTFYERRVRSRCALSNDDIFPMTLNDPDHPKSPKILHLTSSFKSVE